MESPFEHTRITERYRGLEHLSVPVALVDASFNVIHYNPAYRKLLPQGANKQKLLHLDRMFNGFQDKLKVLQDAGLYAGNIMQFRMPGVQLSETNRIFDLHIARLEQSADLLDGYTINLIEVTEREQELKRLRELSDHHLKFIHHTTSGVLIHCNGKLVYVNPQGVRMVRAADAESLIGRSVVDFVTPEFRTIVVERIRRMNEENLPVEVIEEHIIREDKTTFPAEIFAYPVTYDGAPAIKVIINDITKRKEAQLRLQESKQEYQNLIDQLQDVIFRADEKGKIEFLNSAWTELTGYKVEECLGHSMSDYFVKNSDTDSSFVHVIRQLNNGIGDFENDLLLETATGQHIYVRAKFQTIRNHAGLLTGFSGLLSNIHGRKTILEEQRRIENALRRNQNLYLSLAKSMQAGSRGLQEACREIARTSCVAMALDRVNIWQFNETGNELTCLTNYIKQEQTFADEGLVLSDFSAYTEIIREERVLTIDDALQDPRVDVFRDSYIIPDGILSMMDAGIYIGEKLWGVICFDVTESRRDWMPEDRSFAANLADLLSGIIASNEQEETRSALKKTVELNSTILENAGESIFLISQEGLVEDANNMTSRLTGYSLDELTGSSISRFIPEEFISTGDSVVRNIEGTGTFHRTRTLVCADGRTKTVEISVTRLEDSRMVAIMRDITERIEREKALRESEARLDMALKGADLGTWDFFIKENRIIHNRRWGEMLGYHFEITSVNEQFWEKFVHPADIESSYRKFQDHINGLTPFYEANLRMLASNGEWRWILDKGRVVEWDENGEPVRASGIHQDITALKSIEKEIEDQRIFLQQIINAIPDPIYVRNASDEFVVINNAFAEYLGVDRQMVMQYKFNRNHQFHETFQQLIDPDAEILLNQQPLELKEHKLLNQATGKHTWVSTMKVPLTDADGQVLEVLSISTDISDLKNRETSLKEKVEDLSEKLRNRTGKLEQLTKEIDTFHYSVSHDLRTPLRTIDIFAYFLEKRYSDKLDEEGKSNITQIRNSITKMGTLIDNLLIYIRMGKVPVRKKMVQVSDLVQQVIDEMGRSTDLEQVSFEIGGLPVMETDPDMLRQALRNLISNAVKFSATARQPVVQFSSSKVEGYSIIRITDNGVGFNMEFKDKLFKAFKRLHSEEHFEGTGVGLAIVERIVQRLGGEIWAESVEQEYTTFFIKLPLH